MRAVVESVGLVLGCQVPTVTGPRRARDPAVLVASSALIRRETGWQPRHAAIDDIVVTAADWRRAHPDEYGDRGGCD